MNSVTAVHYKQYLSFGISQLLQRADRMPSSTGLGPGSTVIIVKKAGTLPPLRNLAFLAGWTDIAAIFITMLKSAVLKQTV